MQSTTNYHQIETMSPISRVLLNDAQFVLGYFWDLVRSIYIADSRPTGDTISDGRLRQCLLALDIISYTCGLSQRSPSEKRLLRN